MSVSFYVELGEIERYDVTCGCDIIGRTTASYEEASAFLTVWNSAPKAFEGCTDELCLVYPPMIRAVDDTSDLPEVNVSNWNARDVLEALGYGEEQDYCGTASAADFKGRVLTALAVAPVSAERLTEDISREGGPLVIMGGRPEGYIQERLTELHAVAEAAESMGRQVCWG